MSADPPKPSQLNEAKPGSNNIVNALLSGVKLDWVRPLIYKFGGRKVALGALGLYVIREITAMDLSDMVKVGASAGCAVISVGIAWSIGIEDRGKAQKQ